MNGVIYKYTSPSGKIYIGQTCRERGRRNDFLENGEYGGSRIDNARNKYGPSNFTYEVLFRISSCDKELVKSTLNEKEQYYIKHYRSNEDEFGYALQTDEKLLSPREIKDILEIGNFNNINKDYS